MPSRKPQVSQYGSVNLASPSFGGNIESWKLSLIDDEITIFQRTQNTVALPSLIERLSYLHEHVMVISEAIDSISGISVGKVLDDHLDDSKLEDSSSCEVTLHLLALYNTEEWGETNW